MQGVAAVTDVAFTTTTLVAAAPPVGLVPVIVTVVAPGVISEARLKSVTSAHAAAPPSLQLENHDSGLTHLLGSRLINIRDQEYLHPVPSPMYRSVCKPAPAPL